MKAFKFSFKVVIFERFLKEIPNIMGFWANDNGKLRVVEITNRGNYKFGQLVLTREYEGRSLQFSK